MDKYIVFHVTDSILATRLIANDLGIADKDWLRKAYQMVLQGYGIDSRFLDGCLSGVKAGASDEKAEPKAEPEVKPEPEAAPKPEVKAEPAAELAEKPKPAPRRTKATPVEKAPAKSNAIRKSGTLRALLASRKCAITCERFRTILTTKGILQIVAVPGGGGKIYRKLTDEGLVYGKNLRKDDGYKVRYYEDMFDELVRLVKEEQEKK